MSDPYEVLAGPLTLYLAPVGEAYPAIGATPAGNWVKVGTSGTANYADDGVTVNHTQKNETARPAGTTGPIKAWRTEEDLMIGLSLWDMTLEQYATAMNGIGVATVAAGSGTPGTKTMGLTQGQDVKTYALLAVGYSAYDNAMPAQYEVPRCFQSASPKPVFKKGTPAALDLEFTALEDLGASSDDQRFGRLVMQHQAPLP